MKTVIELPRAFSVAHESELPIVKNLLMRLNPKLILTQVATGVHVDGGPTVIWALVYEEGEQLTEQEVHAALGEAGLDLEHTSEFNASRVWVNNHPDLVAESKA